MLPSVNRLGAAAIVAAFALAATVQAQTNTVTRTNNTTFGNNANVGLRVGPGVLLNSPSVNTMMSNPYSPSTSPYYTCYGYCPSGTNYGCYGSGYGYGGGYGGYGGYSGGYGCSDPFNGFLTGAAAVITSQSQFVTAKRQSEVIREQARQAAVDTQRKIYEEWKYERNDQPTLEQIRRDAWEQAYKRSVFHPPLNDIWSADALNRILDHASRAQTRGGAGSTVAVDDNMLKRINFSTGVAGNIGALKNNGKLDWPPILGRKDFAAERARFDQLAMDAYRQGSGNNKVDAGVLEAMEQDLKALDDKLTDRIRDVSPDDYVTAKHYLQDLKAAMKILGRPDVAKHLNNEYAVNAKTIGELVKNMNSNGVRFAKAREGEEWAYNALYKALLTYDLGLGERVAEKTGKEGESR